MAAIFDFGAPARSDAAIEARGRGYVERLSRSEAVAKPAGSLARGPIDHQHLARYTLGNRDLEVEVLGLFVGEAPRTIAAMRAALADGGVAVAEWHRGGHTLKGSARAVGAWRVAEAAEAAERDHTAERSVLLAHLVTLEAVVGDVVAYLECGAPEVASTP